MSPIEKVLSGLSGSMPFGGFTTGIGSSDDSALSAFEMKISQENQTRLEIFQLPERMLGMYLNSFCTFLEKCSDSSLVQLLIKLISNL